MDSPGSIPLLVFILIVLICLSAFFSASETAFMTFSKSKMKTEAEDGKKKAKLVLAIYERYEKLLSTILVGNNIVNILATSLATVLFTSLIDNEELAVTVSTVAMTVIILTLGEITPKTVAKKLSHKISKNFSKPLKFCMALLTPITYLFSIWQNFVLKLAKNDEDSGITEEEIITSPLLQSEP